MWFDVRVKFTKWSPRFASRNENYAQASALLDKTIETAADMPYGGKKTVNIIELSYKPRWKNTLTSVWLRFQSETDYDVYKTCDDCKKKEISWYT